MQHCHLHSATLAFMFASSKTHTSMRRSRLARYQRRRAFAEKQARQRQRLNFVKQFEALQLFTRTPKPLQTGSKPPRDANRFGNRFNAFT